MAVYLDYAATTPLDEDVLKIMTPYLLQDFGNPSSQHSFGKTAANAIVRARDYLAKILGCLSEELYFTSSGTESDNWALKGVCSALEYKGKHIIVSAIEHPALIESAKEMQKKGFEVTFVNAEKDGTISPEAIKNALREDTIFCAVMHANNETGVINPIEEISAVLKEKGVFFFCDCVQTAGYMRLPTKYVDGLSISAHKFYGPKGVGLLYLKKGSQINRLISGGNQERGLRGGTTNTAGIIGLVAAYVKAVEHMETNNDKIRKLRDAFLNKVLAISGATLMGDKNKMLPGHANIAFEGCTGEQLVMMLDNRKVACSTGAACSSGAVKTSHVIKAMGYDESVAKSSVRFTFGKNTSLREIDSAIFMVTTSVSAAHRIYSSKEKLEELKRNFLKKATGSNDTPKN